MLVPWKSGKLHAMTLTLHHIVAWPPMQLVKSQEAENEENYSDLLHSHDFSPVIVETSGVFEPKTMSFIKELEVGKRL